MKWIIIAVSIVLACTAAFAATELNTTTYVDNNTITVGTDTIQVVHSYINQTWFIINGKGRILAEEDCYDLARHYFCIDESTNESVRITWFEKELNVTLTREWNDTLPVSEEQPFVLRVTNHYDQDLDIVVVERTNLTVFDEGNFPALQWKGRLGPSQTRSFRYYLQAPRDGGYYINATAEGFVQGVRVLNTSTYEEITAEDFVTTRVDYVEKPTREKKYNFTLTYTLDDSVRTNSTIWVEIPNTIRIVDDGNLSQQETHLLRKRTNASDIEVYFTYESIATGKEHIIIHAETERATGKTERTHQYAIEEAHIQKLLILHEHQNKTVQVGVPETLRFQILNQNNVSIAADITITSILYNYSAQTTIPAMNSTVIQTQVTPSQQSTYGFILTLTYLDANNDEIVQTSTARIQAKRSTPVTNSVNNTNTTEIRIENIPTQLFIIAQKQAKIQQTIPIRIEIVGLVGEKVNISVQKNNQTIYSKMHVLSKTTTSIGHAVEGPGQYTAIVRLENQTWTAHKIIEEKQEEIVEEQTKNPENSWWIWILLGLILLALIIFVIIRRKS